MKMKISKLPETELEIMVIVWAADKALNCDSIMEQLDNGKNWSKTTVLTFLSRLVKRGFLSVSKEGKVNYYTSLVKENDYLEMEGKSLIGKMCHNSVTDFVAALYQSNSISSEDIKSLKELIKEMK